MFLNKSLLDLDGEDWGEPGYPSHLVVECHRLRTVPLKDFTVENLRIMIGQKICLDYLVPLALMHLIDEPFADGDCYHGDLFNAVIGLPELFWTSHPELRLTLDIVVRKGLEVYENEDELREFLDDQVIARMKKYQSVRTLNE